MKSSALRPLRAYARLLSAGALVIPCFVARFGKIRPFELHIWFDDGLCVDQENLGMRSCITKSITPLEAFEEVGIAKGGGVRL
jgi:hypothetical protein